MSDALVSPAVGGALWAVAAGAGALAARRVEREGDDGRVALMGVLGAFVFAAQMVSFAIPGTGSSGHLSGTLLLAALLGADAALLVAACVLAIQALFFADGGLLALGCNVVNVGLLTTAVAYPLVWKPIAGRCPTRPRLVIASVSAAIAALQLGALAVVLETVASGVTTLPFRSFLLVMQPIHLVIGAVEGVVTGAVLVAVHRVRPDLVTGAARPEGGRRVVVAVAAAALVTAGVLSSLASADPDGLEWAAARASERPPLAREDAVHVLVASVQRATAVLPDYQVRRAPPDASTEAPGAGATPLAGVVGVCLCVGASAAAGAVLRVLRRRTR